MSRYKIYSLYIKNFKCISESNFLFDGDSLVVYDGPNGYGKTTCFEAIEILFAGTTRKSQTSFVDRRYKFRDSPIHKDNEQEIIMSVVLKNDDGNELKIARIFPPAVSSHSNDNNFAKIFGLSKLYINDAIEESLIKEIEGALQYDNIGFLFNLLNYVEQDENTYFLKKDPKNRYSSLESLLGGEEERLLLHKLNGIKDKIKKKKKAYGDEILALQNNNKETISDLRSELVYKRLIKAKDLDWDGEEVKNINSDIHHQYLIDLDKIGYLVENKGAIENVLANHLISTFSNTNLIDIFLKYYWGVMNIASLKLENERRSFINKTIERNNIISNNIDKLKYKNLGDTTDIDYLSEKSEFGDILPLFKTSLRTILALEESLSTDNKILSQLKEKREQLMLLSFQHRNLIPIEDSECPTCGYDWDTNSELLKQIEITEGKIFKSYLASNTEFENIKKVFTASTLESVRSLLLEESNRLIEERSGLIDADHFAEIADYQTKEVVFKEFLDLFVGDAKNRILAIVNHREIEDFVVAKSSLLSVIESGRPITEGNLDEMSIKNDFDFYFSSKLEELLMISFEDVVAKRNYIQWQFYNSISQSITSRQQKWDDLDQAFIKIERLAEKVETQINKYTHSIVEKIKIPFHIYTGKILQNHSLGSGLNIDFEMEKQKQLYITPCYKDQEVAFTLSSGQLSATVISLMLVLNKVFNQSQLGTIFIDDPLQTLDEINAHSLVELLKYNFSEHQIVLSTHEDKYSRFIRYKFDKFGLSNKNINMRDWN